ncbi:hypothetical protein BTO18_14185 [Polaribacter porphyrae]|uniref:TonB-dependent receptor plug domain-containing protein n=2 Tax=Polaribacter porphyrae TaxID=1137780 RepID=A0A2S7WS15_9FLAO|nr:hypothetical protein BTO18_14185 [Polaribacter porphyrae]
MALFTISITQAQKKETKIEDKENLLVKLQEGANPIIYVNGKLFDFPMELIDQSKIASIMVMKKQEALKKYNAPNGVVFIKTKEMKQSENMYQKVSKETKVFSGKKSPMVLIDGKVSDEKTFKELKTYEIESVKIVKGKKAIKEYNAPNGVIIIKTKKM